MITARDLGPLRATVAGWKDRGQMVGVVPTMGALHPGHLSLVAAARAACDRVIATIFVNPRQFDKPDDLLTYPRTEDQDAAMLRDAGVDLLFAPPPEVVYPPGFATSISVSGVSDGLCGAHRPGHFDGVATVVTKLSGMTRADRAFFGEKDWQQLQVVRRLVTDLNIATEIVPCPTLREPDGLAMSSRNMRLDPAQRALAPQLHAQMQAAGRAIENGAAVGPALRSAIDALAPLGPVEYLELRGAEDLAPMATLDRPARLLAAVRLGDVRLIDNIAVTPSGAE